MPKTPPKKQSSQDQYVRSAMRLPADLHAEVKKSAEQNGRTMNAEIIARLQFSPLEMIIQQNEEIQRLLRALLDRN